MYLSGESSLGCWDRLVMALLLFLLPVLCLSHSIQSNSDSELSASPRVVRAVPIYVSQYNPGHHKLVEPYFYSRPAKDKQDVINRSESDLYTSYSTGMWVLGGLFSLVSVVAPGVVSAFSSVEPGKMSEK